MTHQQESKFHIDKFLRALRKKDEEAKVLKIENFKVYENMVEIKNHLVKVKDDENVSVGERAKIFIEKLKALELLGEKYDKGVKKVTDLDNKTKLEYEILIKNVAQLEGQPFDVVRNYISQYIESNNVTH